MSSSDKWYCILGPCDDCNLLIWAYVSGYDDSGPTCSEATDDDNNNDDDDVADANTYEALLRFQDPPVFGPTQACLPQSPVNFSSELPGAPPDHLDSGGVLAGCETTGFIIEPFSSGNPGAPITGPDTLPGHVDLTQQSQESASDSVWAPFRSQCDWEVARWAKMRAPTSSAVDELFAIPEVSNSDELMVQST